MASLCTVQFSAKQPMKVCFVLCTDGISMQVCTTLPIHVGIFLKDFIFLFRLPLTECVGRAYADEITLQTLFLQKAFLGRNGFFPYQMLIQKMSPRVYPDKIQYVRRVYLDSLHLWNPFVKFT